MNVSTAEAKNRLSELIRTAEDGEKVIVTRHGKPVVPITPVPPGTEVCCPPAKR